MPELSRFYNIVIKMLYSDNDQHHKPHFHVFYAEYAVSYTHLDVYKRQHQNAVDVMLSPQSSNYLFLF